MNPVICSPLPMLQSHKGVWCFQIRLGTILGRRNRGAHTPTPPLKGYTNAANDAGVSGDRCFTQNQFFCLHLHPGERGIFRCSGGKLIPEQFEVHTIR